jgi:hypothetical protein
MSSLAHLRKLLSESDAIVLQKYRRAKSTGMPLRQNRTLIIYICCANLQITRTYSNHRQLVRYENERPEVYF